MRLIEFDAIKSRLMALKPELDNLEAALDLESAGKDMAELETQTAADGFWDDPAASQGVLKKLKQLKNKSEGYAALCRQWEDLYTLVGLALEEDDASLLPELTDGLTVFESALSAARLSTLLSGEYDDSNVIVSFHAGAGGTEAQDWTEMLVRMYVHWAERHNMSAKLLDCLDGDEAGIKSAVLLVEGENAFGYLKGEMGVHRLVRISPFDSSGRRHTSFAAVEVMPEVSDDMDIEIRDEDLKIDTYRSGGAGGQHVNKTESAIRITHVPTGIVVACQNERSQVQNRAVCMRMLRSKLVEIKEREHLERIEDIKGVQKSIEWGSQIRSYVFMPYTLVKDHRTAFEAGNIQSVMDGDLDGFIDAYLNALSSGNWAK